MQYMSYSISAIDTRNSNESAVYNNLLPVGLITVKSSIVLNIHMSSTRERHYRLTEIIYNM